VLLPVAFISLLAWATAGSSNGDTSDPMRAALWIWLGAHHIPFHLALPPAGQAGLLSYLPLGALIFPFLAARSGFARAMDQIDRDARGVRLTRSLFSLMYAGIATLLAWVSKSSTVEPILYFVPIATLPLAWFATSTVRIFSPRKQFISFGLAIRVIAVVMGVASIVLAASLFQNRATIANLTLVLEPGWLGGILLFILSVLYIPNAVVATLSYLVGPGFAIGTGTVVSALTHRISEIPALPLLGALPTGRHPFILFSALGISLAGVILFSRTIDHDRKSLFISFILTIVGVAILGFLSSGQLLTNALGTVGVSTWKLTLFFGVEFGFGVLIAWVVPLIFQRMRHKVAR
jgi:hypothetical protein